MKWFDGLPDNVLAGYSTDLGGVSEAPYATLNLAEHVGDAPAAVRVNRQRFNEWVNARIGVEQSTQWLKQVHGNNCLSVDGTVPRAPAPHADGMVTRLSARTLAIMTADCVPVLLYADDGACIGAAHAGWQGLERGILAATHERLSALAPHTPLSALIGPCISQRRYEVGADVWQRFADEFPAALAPHPIDRDKRMLDLAGIAHRQLTALGVSVRHVSGVCTFEAEHLYSYRAARHRQCPETGRFASFIVKIDPV